jgi:hypothetical protein
LPGRHASPVRRAAAGSRPRHPRTSPSLPPLVDESFDPAALRPGRFGAK